MNLVQVVAKVPVSIVRYSRNGKYGLSFAGSNLTVFRTDMDKTVHSRSSIATHSFRAHSCDVVWCAADRVHTWFVVGGQSLVFLLRLNEDDGQVVVSHVVRLDSAEYVVDVSFATENVRVASLFERADRMDIQKVQSGHDHVQAPLIMLATSLNRVHFIDWERDESLVLNAPYACLITAFAFSSSNRGARKHYSEKFAFTLFASGLIWNDILVWSSDKSVSAVCSGHQGTIFSIAFQEPQHREDAAICSLVSAADDRSIRVWTVSRDGAASCISAFTAHSVRIWDLCVVSMGTMLISAGEDGYVRLWNHWNASSPLLCEWNDHAVMDVWNCDVHVDSHHSCLRILAGGNDGATKEWCWQPCASPLPLPHNVSALSFVSDDILLAALKDGNLVLIRASDKSVLSTVRQAHSASVSAMLVLSPSVALCAHFDGRFSLVLIDSGRELVASSIAVHETDPVRFDIRDQGYASPHLGETTKLTSRGTVNTMTVSEDCNILCSTEMGELWLLQLFLSSDSDDRQFAPTSSFFPVEPPLQSTGPLLVFRCIWKLSSKPLVNVRCCGGESSSTVVASSIFGNLYFLSLADPLQVHCRIRVHDKVPAKLLELVESYSVPPQNQIQLIQSGADDGSFFLHEVSLREGCIQSISVLQREMFPFLRHPRQFFAIPSSASSGNRNISTRVVSFSGSHVVVWDKSLFLSLCRLPCVGNSSVVAARVNRQKEMSIAVPLQKGVWLEKIPFSAGASDVQQSFHGKPISCGVLTQDPVSKTVVLVTAGADLSVQFSAVSQDPTGSSLLVFDRTWDRGSEKKCMDGCWRSSLLFVFCGGKDSHFQVIVWRYGIRIRIVTDVNLASLFKTAPSSGDASMSKARITSCLCSGMGTQEDSLIVLFCGTSKGEVMKLHYCTQRFALTAVCRQTIASGPLLALLEIRQAGVAPLFAATSTNGSLHFLLGDLRVLGEFRGLHLSGMSSMDIVSIVHEGSVTRFTLVTGGDDSNVALSCFEYSVCSESVVLRWTFRASFHFAGVVGVTYLKTSKKLVSLGRDMKICSYSISDDGMSFALDRVQKTDVFDVFGFARSRGVCDFVFSVVGMGAEMWMVSSEDASVEKILEKKNLRG
ncbi:putative mitochondrial protein [Andalucia godoyi]|uniref:Putative mitochondrial protein n=1 Tax=Andalucia godoyi TaxID=505711 RepID=A0A8K0AJ47_ANDGO|nr:putative mitochondrial protein [Andalucia godoyi]|eukprot:ANDGO_06216.mRNA.1 putative mitochondrial protein